MIKKNKINITYGFSLLEAIVSILVFSICIPTIFHFAESLFLGTLKTHNLITEIIDIKNYFYEKPSINEENSLKIKNSDFKEHITLKQIETKNYEMFYLELKEKDFEESKEPNE